ncbi:MAG: acyl carrier protein [Phycisphaerales bacterium]|nr:acyl carrier protein [Phycisphaerales bacterium]
MAAPSREEIFGKVRQALVDALSVDPEDVSESATLTGDLQAESIDILDIVFRLEKAFSIKISQEELTPRDVISNPDYVVNRKLNAAGLAALRQRVERADFSKFEKDPDIDKILDVFTVGTIVNFIESKLKAQG